MWGPAHPGGDKSVVKAADHVVEIVMKLSRTALAQCPLVAISKYKCNWLKTPLTTLTHHIAPLPFQISKNLYLSLLSLHAYHKLNKYLIQYIYLLIRTI